MKKRIHIALITAWYPPSKSIAVNRMHAFAKYLSQSEDIRVSVFTIGEILYRQENEFIKVYAIPPSKIGGLLKNKSSDTRIIHIIRTLFNILYTKVSGSPFQFWRKKIIYQLAEIHSHDPFSIILSSYSPEDAHLVVLDFLKKGNVIPWIADMRDEMSLNPGLSNAKRESLRLVEYEIDKYASAITSVSLPIVNDFKHLCSNVTNFEEVRNGFDHDLTFNKHRNNVFTLGYFGTFYGNIKPTHFFVALNELKLKYPYFNFKVELYGVHNNYTTPSSLTENIEVFPALPYTEAISRMAEMDALILLLPKQDRKGVYSGKIFDYLSVNKPIIATVDVDDVAAELLNSLQNNYVCQFDDVNAIKELIWTCYQEWINIDSNFERVNDIQSFHRKFQVNKLEFLIKSLL